MTDSALSTVWARAWQLIEHGTTNSSAAARLPILATAGLNGGASARIVVLRKADRHIRRLELHTDAASTKAAELARDPGASLLIWVPQQAIQLRLTLDVTLIHGDAQRWEKIPETSRAAYGGAPAPGRPLGRPEDWRPSPRPDRHLALVCDVTALEWLEIGHDLHKRALFAPANGWSGQWIAP